jgi:hypothetical protein
MNMGMPAARRTPPAASEAQASLFYVRPESRMAM